MSRILVVDDASTVRKMVRLTLEKAGYIVEVAENAEAGLTRFGDGSGWDLVLTDQRMPGLQGQEMATELRRRDPAARIIMMTAYPSVALASEVMQSGAVDFLRKPFSTDMLRGAVRSALARSKELHQAAAAAAPTRSSPVPQITYYFNGFDFWPIEVPGAAHADSLGDIKRAFAVRGPQGDMKQCLVVVTPHVGTEIQTESQRQDPGDEIWSVVCRDALANFLWEDATMPPAVLPIYELTHNQIHDVQALSRVGYEAD